MRSFIDEKPVYELTYADVFILPGHETSLSSRMDVDMSIPADLPLTNPVMVANMTAVAGVEMAEVTARRGAMTMLVQGQPLKKILADVKKVKEAHPIFDTPVVISEDDTMEEKYSLKTPHGNVVVVDNDGNPVGVYNRDNFGGFSQRAGLVFEEGTDLLDIFSEMSNTGDDFAVVKLNNGNLGVITAEGIVRSSLHRPAVDKEGKLVVGVALGINENIAERVEAYKNAGVDTILLDTANGHQERLIAAVAEARTVAPDMFIIAGTVVTRDGTAALIKAGANMVKVGIGAGAMCITRMRTGVGRPQFSAVLECADEAKKLGGTVLADGGIKHPRDVALAMAAGAACTMIGSWFAPTYESAGEVVRENCQLFVEHYGMASTRAVSERDHGKDRFLHMKKAFFEEGASDVKMRLKEGQDSAEIILDQISSGLRSTCSYVGVDKLSDLSDNAVIGVQSPAAFGESSAVSGTW